LAAYDIANTEVFFISRRHRSVVNNAAHNNIH